MAWWPDSFGPYLPLESRAGGREGISRYLFVDMHCLSMLP